MRARRPSHSPGLREKLVGVANLCAPYSAVGALFMVRFQYFDLGCHERFKKLEMLTQKQIKMFFVKSFGSGP